MAAAVSAESWVRGEEGFTGREGSEEAGDVGQWSGVEEDRVERGGIDGEGSGIRGDTGKTVGCGIGMATGRGAGGAQSTADRRE